MNNLKKKCFNCKKKLGLIPFNCKCSNTFCTKCRLPSDHNCTYDYRAEGKEKILKENPVVIADKIKVL